MSSKCNIRSMRKSFGCLFGLCWLAFSLAQIAAVAGALQVTLGFGSFAAGALAIIFGWWPVVGTFIATAGAHFAWGWSWWASAALFWGLSCGFLMLLLLTGGLTIMMGKWSRRPEGRTIEVSSEDTQVFKSIPPDRDRKS
jgi:hypothetical protein